MSTWLELRSNSDGWTLVDHGRLRELRELLDDPLNQRPATSLFLGGATKSTALKSIFPHSNTQRRCSPGILKLHMIAHSSDTPRPILVFEGNHHVSPRSLKTSPASARHIRCVENQSYDATRNKILSCAICPFVHTIYMFVDDLGGIDEVQKILWSWLTDIAHRYEPFAARPVLVLVMTKNERAAKPTVLDYQLQSSLLEKMISGLVTLDLTGRQSLSPCARFQPLQSIFFDDAQAGLDLHDAEKELFSMIHLESLLKKALLHITQQPDTIFSPVHAAREENPVPAGAMRHLRQFISSTKTALSQETQAHFIANALLMDAYPPNMHCS